MRRRGTAIAVAVATLALLASVAMAVTGVHWHGLQSVKVTVSNSSLPPPGGAPKTTSFTSGDVLKDAQSALNKYGVTRRAASNPSHGCSGGYNVVIKLVKQNGARETLRAYECGGVSFGSTAGNIPGFLGALGISPP